MYSVSTFWVASLAHQDLCCNNFKWWSPLLAVRKRKLLLHCSSSLNLSSKSSFCCVIASFRLVMAGNHISLSPFSSAAVPPISVAGDVHPLAASGFDADQGIYESARPSYPAAVLELVKREIVPLLGNPATASNLSVLDLAAGTGKWTRLLLSSGIGRLVAVEPSPGMRKEFEALLFDVVILDGSATAIPVADESVDIIFVAQAFHWFSNVSALMEMHRVLKKEGAVVLIWNMEDRKTSWVARLREAYEKHEAGSPQYRLGLWRRPFEEPEMVQIVSKMFQLPFQERQFKHSVLNTKNDVWQRVLSKSYIAVLESDQKDKLKEEVDNILEGQDINWDTQGGDYKVLHFPYTTDVVWFKKLSQDGRREFFQDH